MSHSNTSLDIPVGSHLHATNKKVNETQADILGNVNTHPASGRRDLYSDGDRVSSKLERIASL